MARRSSPLSLALACLLCLAQALRPSAYSATRAAPLRPSAVVSRRQLVAAAAAVSSLPLPPASAAPNKNLKAKKTLKPELVAILRVKESTSQETRLISTGKFKDLQRLNIKRAVGMMIDNSDLRERFVAASYYCDPMDVAAATQYGNTAVESLIQIIEYFPDKLKVNDLTNTQKQFVLAALESTSRNIDSFIALMPAEQVKAAQAQIDEENALNLAELPEDVTLLNPPTIGLGGAAEPPPALPPPPPAAPPAEEVAST